MTLLYIPAIVVLTLIILTGCAITYEPDRKVYDVGESFTTVLKMEK